MRKGLQAKILRDFAPFMPPDWRLIGTRFMRRSGSWVQLVRINPSRWDDTFQPSTGLEYLPLPSEPPPLILGGVAESGLLAERHPVDRWYSIREHERDPRAILERMAEQFRPRIDEPLTLEAIREVLEARANEWPCLYSLCVMAAEAGDGAGARRRFEDFRRLVAGRPFDDRVAELRQLLALMDRPAELEAHLRAIEEAKLASLKGRPLG